MSAPEAGVLETVLKRDRAVVLAALGVIVVLAWAYLVGMALDMRAMPDMESAMGAAMTAMAPWSAADVLAMFVMWAVMMVGMMLPSAAPMILMVAKVNRKTRAGGGAYMPTAAFTLGYVIAWTAFSLVATALQGQLNSWALLTPMMVSSSAAFGGVLFVLAGVYQFSPWKNACLVKCRSPIDFVLNHWRDGMWGALRMGLSHGLYCVGCCWFLMGLLFAGGVMNLAWVAAIAIFVLAEKVLPSGPRGGRWIAGLSGAAMTVFGLVLVYQGVME
jgi:predicted metal-binding membrane protein